MLLSLKLSFYLHNEAIVRAKNIDLLADPPLDLVLKSDYTSSSLGVPELWRYRGKSLEVYQLIGGKYELCAQSLAFSFFAIADIPSFIEQSKIVAHRAAVRLFRSRIRDILPNSDLI